MRKKPSAKAARVGFPADPRDWTADDWRTLHTGIEAVKAEIAARHSGSNPSPSDWIPVVDADGNPNLPTDEREVLVFLCGDRGIGDPRPDDAPWGMGFGWFDQEKRCWRVGGRPEGYVTHWREKPREPETAR